MKPEVDNVAEPDDLCTICERPMPDPTMENAIFGTHIDCMNATYPTAVSAADEVCALSEALTGENANVAAIIASHFGRARVTNQPNETEAALAESRETLQLVKEVVTDIYHSTDIAKIEKMAANLLATLNELSRKEKESL